HAQVEPCIGATRAEPGSGASDGLVGHLPVDVQPFRIDRHGGDAVLPVTPGDVLYLLTGLARREPPIELVVTGRGLWLLRRHGARAIGLLNLRGEGRLGEAVDSLEANAPRVLDQLGPRAAEQILEFRAGWHLPLRPHRPLFTDATLALRFRILFGHRSRFAQSLSHPARS